MLYTITTALALGYTLSGVGLQSPAMQPVRAQAARHIQMDGTGTETLDFTLGELRGNRDVVDEQMRPKPGIDWSNLRARLEVEFGYSDEQLKKYDAVSGEDALKAYEMMQLCRNFENACNQAYMQGNIRGFMHLDNG